MNKRRFFKSLAACLGAIPFVGNFMFKPSPKEYITRAKWDDVVGLHVDCVPGVTDFTGTWKITRKAPESFDYLGNFVLNQRGNKFFAAPLANPSFEVLVDLMPVYEKGVVGYADLSFEGCKFYKPT